MSLHALPKATFKPLALGGLLLAVVAGACCSTWSAVPWR
jgi:hypothetical protein